MFRDTFLLYEFRGPWGVPVQIGASIILLPLILINFGGSAQALAYDVMFVMILIGSIYLHELGHAWGSLIQGIPVNRIMIHGGGGFCQRARSANRYERELLVAMGPIVNLTLWAVAGLIAPLVADPEIRWVFETISWVNGFLAILNLLPIHPLDGGKLFELALHRILQPQAVRLISGVIGLMFALAWLPLMVYGFATFGFVLFFLPSVRLHWDMLRGLRRA